MKSLSNFVIFPTLFQIADSLSANHHQQYKRHAAQPRVVSLPFHRSEVRDPIAQDRNRMRRRDGTIQTTIDNLQTLYFLNASLGTPPQDIRLHLDTGSSDLWVNTPASKLCSSTGNRCSYSHTYSANVSSTYQYVGSYFNISYVDGSGAAGDYATDTMRLASTNVSSFQFGIGYESTSPQNVLGIGYPANEVQVLTAGRQSYQNLPAKMRANGLISSNAYSLWLNDLNAQAGSILFGGIDTSKYEGSLVSVPIQKVNNAYSQFIITMTGIDVGSKTVASNIAHGVLLDSGSSLTYLPIDIVAQVYQLVNAKYQEADGAAFVPCSLRNQNTTMTFNFSSPAAITVNLADMILDLDDLSGKSLTFNNNVEVCLFGIAPAGDSMSVLGDTFLRSAYVVYDMDNNEISLANSKFNATESNIVEIKSGSKTVPSSVKASSPVVATDIPGVSSIGANRNASQSDSGAGGLEPLFAPVALGIVAVAAGLFL